MKNNRKPVCLLGLLLLSYLSLFAQICAATASTSLSIGWIARFAFLAYEHMIKFIFSFREFCHETHLILFFYIFVLTGSPSD